MEMKQQKEKRKYAWTFAAKDPCSYRIPDISFFPFAFSFRFVFCLFLFHLRVAISMSLRTSLRFQRKPFRMFNNLSRQIDVQIGPIKVTWRRFLHIEDLAHRYILEPRKVAVRHKQLPRPNEKPDSVTRNVRNLSR